MRSSALPFALAAAASLLTACSDATSPGSGPTGTVSLSFSTMRTGRIASAGIVTESIYFGVTSGPAVPDADPTLLGIGEMPTTRSPDAIAAAGGAVIITRAQIVLKKIELKSPDYVCGLGDDGRRSRHDADCEVDLGPRIVDLPVQGGVSPFIDVAVPEGIYREIEFRLHKPDDDTAADIAFIAANPGFRRISVRVEGTWNGQPFAYESDPNAMLELEFASPLHVDASGVNITVDVDVASWFRDSAGTALRPSPETSRSIDDNIRRSFRAFEDRDRDGDDDNF